MKAFLRKLIRHGNALTAYFWEHVLPIPENPPKKLIIGLLILHPFVIGINFIAWFIGVSYLIILSIYSPEGLGYLFLLYIPAILIYSLTPLSGFNYVWNNWHKKDKLDPEAISYYKKIGFAYIAISILMPPLFLSLIITCFLTKYLCRINKKASLPKERSSNRTDGT